jgi:hypothetical protein
VRSEKASAEAAGLARDAAFLAGQPTFQNQLTSQGACAVQAGMVILPALHAPLPGTRHFNGPVFGGVVFSDHFNWSFSCQSRST